MLNVEIRYVKNHLHENFELIRISFSRIFKLRSCL